MGPAVTKGDRPVVPKLSEAPAPPQILDIQNIAKSFGGAKALRGVSLSVRPGEIHGLLGRNGSGKSTLVRIMAGFLAPDPGGQMRFNGRDVSLPIPPGHFRKLGMSFVHQSLGLLPSLTVLENFRLNALTSQNRFKINWAWERAQTRLALSRFQIDLDPDAPVDRLSPVNRALLAIARAFDEIGTAREGSNEPGLVILDEPTPFLPKAGVDRLFELIRHIADEGSAVVFISHDIDEIKTITDRVTVLRDGLVAGSVGTREASHEQIIEMIVGRRLLKSPGRAKSVADKPVYATVTGLAHENLEPIAFEVRRGEILGLTGLLGSGFDLPPYLLMGGKKCIAGSITLAEGLAVDLRSMTPKAAMEAGFALLPADRQGASGVDELSIYENMLLPQLPLFFRRGRLRAGLMKARAFELGKRFQVMPNRPNLPLGTLSGGNAQKVLLARWMDRKPDLLLLDEPTQGVDVGTRAQMFTALREAAAAGMSIVCASTDAEQLAEICDRVIVFARGRFFKEIPFEEVSKDEILRVCYTSTDLEQVASAA